VSGGASPGLRVMTGVEELVVPMPYMLPILATHASTLTVAPRLATTRGG
jgi:hypothetical protein